jgi:hypothetical protein
MTFDTEPIMREIILEIEYIIEKVVGYYSLVNKQMNMLMDTPKRWDILYFTTFDRDQVEKLQAATRAPLTDELEIR